MEEKNWLEVFDSFYNQDATFAQRVFFNLVCYTFGALLMWLVFLIIAILG